MTWLHLDVCETHLKISCSFLWCVISGLGKLRRHIADLTISFYDFTSHTVGLFITPS